MRITARTYGGQIVRLDGIQGADIAMERQGNSWEDCFSVSQFREKEERIDLAVKVREYYWDKVNISGLSIRLFEALKALASGLKREVGKNEN